MKTDGAADKVKRNEVSERRYLIRSDLYAVLESIDMQRQQRLDRERAGRACAKQAKGGETKRAKLAKASSEDARRAQSLRDLAAARQDRRHRLGWF